MNLWCNMMALRRAFFILMLLLECKHLSEGSVIILENPSSRKSTSVPLESVRSTNILHLGNEANLGVLVLEFHWSILKSSLSSFDFRTYDSEGIIFYAEIDGPQSWFLLALRQSRLEIQMSNEDGQLMGSQWGPIMSDGKWRRVSVDKNENAIEVKVDDELVLNLIHYLRIRHTQLIIALGGVVPNTSAHLLRPLQFSLDGCMRNWSWVKSEVLTLNNAMKVNEQRRCFEHEEEGSYFPGSGYAQFDTTVFSKDAVPWDMGAEFYFRSLQDSGVLFAVQGQNDTTSFSFAMDNHKQAFTITLFDKQFSKPFPVDFNVGHWQTASLKLQNPHLTLKTPTMQAIWSILHEDFSALERDFKMLSTTINIGGIPDSTAESSYFTGCMKMFLQGKQVDLDLARKKHEHIRTHSCPTY